MSLSYQKEIHQVDFIKLSAEDCDLEDQKEEIHDNVDRNGVYDSSSNKAQGGEKTCSWEYIVDEVW